MYDPLIFTSKKVLLQAVLDAVGHGCTNYVSGTTPLHRLELTVAHFAGNYRAFEDKNARAQRSRMGLGNIRVFFYYRDGDDFVSWWLLAMPPAAGKHPVHSTENLRDVFDRDDRIVIFDLELVRLPKAETSKSKLTWRMTDELYQSMAEDIKDAVRSRSYPQMARVLVSLRSKPNGFNGARVQYGYSIALYNREVKRASLKNAPIPPDKLPYTRRIRHDGISVKQLLAMTRHD